MAINNFIYSEVSQQVRDTLDKRKKLIGEEVRTAAGLEWDLQRSAYASMYLLKDLESEEDPKYSRYTRDLFTNSDIQTDADGNLIRVSIRDHKGFKQDYNPDERYMPSYPALTEVTVTNQARLGSIRKAQVRISTFSLEQFDRFRAQFLQLRKWISLEWGWGVLRGELDKDQFVGRVYNFSYTLRNDASGGFDIILDLVGPGSVSLSAPLNGLSEALFARSEDGLKLQLTANPFQALEEDIKQLTTSTVVALSERFRTELGGNQATIAGLSPGVNTKFILEIESGQSTIDLTNFSDAYKSVDVTYQVEETQQTGKYIARLIFTRIEAVGYTVPQTSLCVDMDPFGGYSTSKYRNSYIKLGHVLRILNALYDTYIAPVNIKGNASGYDPNLLSSDPSTVVFPDSNNADYTLTEEEVSQLVRGITITRQEALQVGENVSSNEVALQVSDDDPVTTLGKDELNTATIAIAEGGKNLSFTNDFKAGEGDNLVQLENILISLPYLASVFERSAIKEGYLKKDTMANFLTELFSKIRETSGGLYELSVRENYEGASKGLQVVDINFNTRLEDNEPVDIQPYEITTHRRDSLVRGISLVSELSSRVAASLYAENLGVSTSEGTTTDSDNKPRRVISSYSQLKNAVLAGIPFEELEFVGVDAELSRREIQSIRNNLIVYHIEQFLVAPEPETKQVVDLLKSLNTELGLGSPGSIVSVLMSKSFKRLLSTAGASLVTYPKPALIPLNLKVDIDGIKGGGFDSTGIKYGNIITTNWLPEAYKQVTEFVVTNITHKITTHDWLTTLETVINFRPDKALARIQKVTPAPKPANATDESEETRKVYLLKKELYQYR